MLKHEVDGLQSNHGGEMESPEKESLSAGGIPRRRFWEMDHFFKCPVAGMCLSAAEAKQLLKKAGYRSKGKSSFELHEALVASSDSENRLSRKIDSLLSRKFKLQTESLYRLEVPDFLQHWRSSFEKGDFRGVFWAAASRTDLSVEARREIFGMVHMAMHGNVDRIARLKQRLIHEQAGKQKGDQRYEREVRARQSLQKDNIALGRKLQRLQEDLMVVERDKAKLASELARLQGDSHRELERENDRLRVNLEETSRRLRRFADESAGLKRENQRLSAEWKRQQDLNARIGAELEGMARQFAELNECSGNCPTFDLCRKRILIVGGITRMESLYRRLIEGSGGILEYHDGNLKSGLKNLEGRLRRADLVLCPINCNSHAACSMVKRLGKKYNKPVHMLGNSSLSGISQVIWGEETGGQAGSIPSPSQSNN